MIIVDATVLVDFFIGLPSRQESACRLLAEDPEWISVSLWRYELGNALRSGVRSRDCDLDEVTAFKHLKNAETLILETIENPASLQVLELANQRGLTMYDASYVWAAKTRGLKLRTRDTDILKFCPEVALPMPGMGSLGSSSR